MYARKDETWSERTAVSKYNLARRAPARARRDPARPQRSGHRRGRTPERSPPVRGPRSRDAPRTQQGAGPSAGLPARRHTPPAFSTVGFVAACLQKKLTKPPSTHPARRGRRESGVRGVGSHYADRYHDGLSPYRSHHIGSHQPVSTVGCVYAPIASAAEVRYIPDPSLKRQIRCLKKGALPFGFASRPHPNGPLLLRVSHRAPRSQ